MIKSLEIILSKISNEIIMNPNFINKTTYKTKDLVTLKDVAAERAIISELKALYPEDVFISEEEHHSPLTDLPTWIIDPIDGTLNFTRHIPQFGIQLSKYIHKKPTLAMMYFPVEEVTLYAEKNKGCYMNQKKIYLEPFTLKQSIVTFGDFSNSQPASRLVQLDLMGKIMPHVMKTRIYGASSTDFGYVIMNKTQCHIMFSKRIWEFAAGLFMAQEAGLKVSKFEIGDITGLIVGQSHLVNEITSLLEINPQAYF